MSSVAQPTVHDLIGIGFGPSNLALAIAVSERAETPLSAVFLERQETFGWHRGMLLEDATMQVSFFKDLVTMRDPTSDFSFLCFLKERGRLVDFINHKTLFPLRIEFHEYFTWAAQRVEHLVRYRAEVTAIEPVLADGEIVAFDVVSTEHGNRVVRRARNLSVATGLDPFVPADAIDSPRVWHNVQLLPRVAALHAENPRRVLVVGAGQSAAETVAYLHREFPTADVHAVFAKFGYTPADDSPYANRIFDPAAVDAFYSAPSAVKDMLLGYHRSTNYSVVDLDLIEALYREEYRERVQGRRRLHIHNASRVRRVVTTPAHLLVDVEHLPSGEVTTHQVDQLVYATGYRPVDPARLLGAAADLCQRDSAGDLCIGRDYRLALRTPGAASIYLQGGSEHAHGLSATLLSTVAVRAGEIRDSLLTRIAAKGRHVPTDHPTERYAPFPLTDQQQAYLVGRAGDVELGNVSTHAYYEYEGALDLARFNRAWQRVIDRHDMLRVVVDPHRGEQRVLSAVPPFAAEILDLRGHPAAAVETALAEVRDRMSHEVRPAETYPLFGVAVSLLDEERCRVHISFDGLTLDYLSWQLLVADLTRFYNDPELELPPLEFTFREYLAAEEQTRSGERYERAERYWTERASELPPAPLLPSRVDPATVTHPRWTSRLGTLQAESWRELKAVAARAGLTPTALVLAAFAEVLAVWGEEPRFTINVPRMNRVPLHPQVNEILGEFASFSLLGVEHDGSQPFEQRAKCVQAQLWDDLAHQQVTGVRVLRELRRAEGGRPRALMPVVFTSTLGFTAGPQPLLGSRLPRVYAVSQTPQVYLDVQVEEIDGALVHNWDSVEELFPAGLIDAAFAAFCGLLERLARDTDLWHLADLGLVEPAHRTHDGVAGPVREVPAELVQDAFAAQVAARPDHVAVLDPARTLTYSELDRRARGVAEWLLERGVAANEPVAVVMDKGWEQVVAAHGALLAGTPYVPIDAALPPARVATLLEKVGVAAVLTQRRHRVGHAGLFASLVGNEDILAVEDAPQSTGPLPVRQTPDDPAYVLCTSGSTGTPKAVVVGHRGMVNALRETAAEFNICADDVVLGVTALHHDMSTFDVFGVLGAGGTLVLPLAERAREAAHWADLIAAHGVSVWNSVPAMMEMLLEHLDTAASQFLPSLRVAFLGGDWIPLTLPERLAALAPDARLVSVGGPTETTLWNIWFPVERVAPQWRSIPYGRPIANTRYYVLDRWLRPRPEGVAGELCVAGVGLAHGYRNDPTATEAAFVRHPRTGERLYRTGDLGRCDADGLVEFVGRTDGQVKIRGHRIELGEVEAAILSLPQVSSAVVTALVRADRPGHKGLAAHVVLTADARANEEDLRAALRTRLPEHMVPATVAILDALPMTSNGKVDRKALAALAALPASEVDGAVAPSTALESVVTKVWADVLDVAQVGVHDDFFALGGDSVLATRIVARLREALDTPQLGLLTLFTTVTVHQLCAAMLAEEGTPGRLEQIAQIWLEVAELTDAQIEERLMHQ